VNLINLILEQGGEMWFVEYVNRSPDNWAHNLSGPVDVPVRPIIGRIVSPFCSFPLFFICVLPI